MASRRSLTTTTAAAAGVLIALCFVPSASATPVAGTGQTGTVSHAAAPAGATTTQPAAHDLADTGAIDTTPYLVGGTGFLAVGGALLLVARRRALVLGLAPEGWPGDL